MKIVIVTISLDCLKNAYFIYIFLYKILFIAYTLKTLQKQK